MNQFLKIIILANILSFAISEECNCHCTTSTLEKDNSSKCEDLCIPCDNETKVMCYFTNWAWYRKDYGKFLPSDIDPSLCTHIIYAFAALDNETYTIKSYDEWSDIDNNFYTLITSLQEKGVKAILALGGWNDSEGDKYSKLVSNSTLRKNFIRQSIVFLSTYNFSGLELDWEYPHCWQGDCDQGPESDVENFALLVKELSLAYRQVGYTVSVAVGVSIKLTDNCYDVPTLSCYLDWINFISYDYYSASAGVVLPNSPFYQKNNDSVVFNLKHWEAKGAKRCKLNIGIPGYGHTFILANSSNHEIGDAVTGAGAAGNITLAEGVLSYYEICLKIKDGGYTSENSWDNGAIAYEDDFLISYTNIDDIEYRTGLVKTDCYGGVFFYDLSYDDFTNVCGCGKFPLLTTINRELRGLKTPRIKCY
uniref:GH18 domain-containing protein n=1 Tax=Clastoptera arizonana TaxID=38151 RepID=A0A1B6DCK4_9HEMI